MSEGQRPDEERVRELRAEFRGLWEARDASEGSRVLTRTLSLTNSLGGREDLRKIIR